MKDLVEEIAKALVDAPDSVTVKEVEGERVTVLELRVAPVLAADLVEGLLALQRVETACEDIAFATAITVPKLNRGFVVDGARNVDG